MIKDNKEGGIKSLLELGGLCVQIVFGMLAIWAASAKLAELDATGSTWYWVLAGVFLLALVIVAALFYSFGFLDTGRGKKKLPAEIEFKSLDK